MTFNIKTDSRKIKKGDTFVAIKTILSDGHKYIEAAIKAGASKIVCSEGDYSVETLKVEDTRAYLYDYLKETYKDIFSNMKIIVVTGTNGKTTMAYLMYQALNLLGRNASYLGTLGFYKNSGKQYKLDNTTPDICEIYESMVDAYNSGSEYFILEASSQGIAQGRLETLKYDYAVFTNLTHDHLDFHKTMENYALAKLRVFEELKEDGKAFINFDDSYCNYYSLAKNTNITYGKNGGDYKIVDFNFSINGTSFSLENENQIYNFNMPLIGEYNIYNITPVIAILRDLGYSFEEISSITPKLNNGKGRMETIKYKNNLIIVDYAHTPDGIEKIAKTVNEVIKGNIYIIFGVRGNRDRTKRADMTRIATDLAKSVILTTNHLNQEDINQIIGDLTNGVTAKNYEVILDRKKAIEKGISYLQNNDALLILGKGHEDYLNLGDHTIHFDDVEEAKKIIEELNVSQ